MDIANAVNERGETSLGDLVQDHGAAGIPTDGRLDKGVARSLGAVPFREIVHWLNSDSAPTPVVERSGDGEQRGIVRADLDVAAGADMPEGTHQDDVLAVLAV